MRPVVVAELRVAFSANLSAAEADELRETPRQRPRRRLHARSADVG